MKPHTESYFGVPHDESWFEMMGEELEVLAETTNVHSTVLFLAQLISSGNLVRAGDKVQLNVHTLDGFPIEGLDLSAEQVYLLRRIEDGVAEVENALVETVRG